MGELEYEHKSNLALLHLVLFGGFLATACVNGEVAGTQTIQSLALCWEALASRRLLAFLFFFSFFAESSEGLFNLLSLESFSWPIPCNAFEFLQFLVA